MIPLKNTHVSPCSYWIKLSTRLQARWLSELTSGAGIRKPGAGKMGSVSFLLRHPGPFAFYTTNMIPHKNVIKMILDNT